MSPVGTFSVHVCAALAETSRLEAETRCASGTSSLPRSNLMPRQARMPDSVHDGEALLSRVHRRLAVQASLHRAKETHGKTTQHGVTFASGSLLPRRRRLAPRGLARVAHA